VSYQRFEVHSQINLKAYTESMKAWKENLQKNYPSKEDLFLLAN